MLALVKLHKFNTCVICNDRSDITFLALALCQVADQQITECSLSIHVSNRLE